MYFIYPIHLFSRHVIDHQLSPRRGACHSLLIFHLGVYWHSGTSFINFQHLLSPFSPGWPILISEVTERGEKNTLGTRLPALIWERNWARVYVEFWISGCRLPQFIKIEWVLCKCGRTVICIMSLNDNSHCCHIFWD